MGKQTVPSRIAVIMAGGVGERFWPLSRRHRPKQLLRLTQDQETLLEAAVQRVTPLIKPSHVYVATGEHLVAPIRDAGVGVPDENVIAEPCKRNTAGCLAYATAHVLAKYGAQDEPEAAVDMTMAVLTADHVIGDVAVFRRTIEAAMDAAQSLDALATLGVVPQRPDTGYGYIEVNVRHGPLPDYREPVPVYPVEAFREKPDPERAQAFVESGHFFWNAGMFFWRIATFLAALEDTSPSIAEAIHAMTAAMRAGDDGQVRRVFEGLDNISIDYALMERAPNVVVARADFPWDDVGTWSALERTHAADAAGNVVVGGPVVIDCTNSVVLKEGGADRAVGVVGMDNVVVVATDDAVLVVAKDSAQDVRKVVDELKRRNAPQL